MLLILILLLIFLVYFQNNGNVMPTVCEIDQKC